MNSRSPGSIAVLWFNRLTLATGIAVAAMLAIGVPLFVLLSLEVIYWPHSPGSSPVPRSFWISLEEVKGRVERRRQETGRDPANLREIWEAERETKEGYRNLSQTLRLSRGKFVERRSGLPVELVKRDGQLGLAIDGVDWKMCVYAAAYFRMYWDDYNAGGSKWYVAMRVGDRELRPSAKDPKFIENEAETVCGPKKEGVKLRVEWLGL